MCIKELNDIPKKLAERELSELEAINYLTIFFQQNSRLFNISTQDEDFKSEMILYLLSKGHTIFQAYNPKLGDFFNFFYSVVKNIETACKRKQSRYISQEEHNLSENIWELSEKCERYGSPIKDPVPGKVPYRASPVDVQAFQAACKDSKYKIKRHLEKDDGIPKELKEKLKNINPVKLHKMIITVSLKSSYYLDDSSFDRISLFCSYDKDKLADNAQQLKSKLYEREKNKKRLEERRNKAYFHHVKYQRQMHWMKNNPENYDEYKYNELKKKYDRQTQIWEKLNNQLNKGITNIRPTNKAIADVLGICERQVSYYIRCMKDLGF